MTDAEILEKVRMIKDYKQAVKQFQDEVKATEKQLREMMDEKGVSEYCVDVFTLHYSDVETERFDSKAFAKTHEKLYEHYMSSSLVDSDFDDMEAKLTAKGIQLLAGVIIVSYIRKEGFEISQSSVQRYASSLNQTLQSLKLAQENFRAVMEETEKYKNLDVTDGILRLLSNQVFQSINNLSEEQLNEIDFETLMKNAVVLTKASAETVQLMQ